MKFDDRNNKFELWYYGQVNSKWQVNTFDANIYFAGDGTHIQILYKYNNFIQLIYYFKLILFKRFSYDWTIIATFWTCRAVELILSSMNIKWIDYY